MIFGNLANWLISTIGAFGYTGIFILMALESSIVPVPAELVLIPAGFLVFKGILNFWLVFFLATLGSLVGALVSYWVALALGRRGVEKLVDKYGKVAFIEKESLIKSEKFFENHGHITIFIARFIPVIRHLISLPAGFSKMDLAEFSFYTVIGAGIWNLILILLGYFAGQNEAFIAANQNWITAIVIVLAVVVVAVYVMLLGRKRRNS